MADNVELTAGSGGATIATDDDGVAQHQYVKVEFGADNTQTKVTSTEGLPIQNDDTDLKVTLDSEAVVLGVGSATIGKLATNSGVDIGDVDVTSHPADTFVAEDGALGKGVLIQGDDATDRHNLACDTSGRLQVDIAEQSDAANLKVTLDGEEVVLGASDGTDIGNVDVASQPADTFVAEGGAFGKGVLLQGDDGTDRKNINVNATTGDLQVDIAVALPAGTNAIGKLAANSGVDIGDVDVASQPADTFVAEDGALGKGVLLQGDDGTDRKNINVDATTGDLQVDVTNTITETNSGDIKTAVEKIDDAIDGTEMQVDIVSQPARDRTTDNVGAALVTDVLMNDTTALTPKFANINGNTSGNNTLVAAVSGKKVRVLAMSLVAAGNVTVTIEDGAAGPDLLGPLEFDGSTQPKGISLSFCPVGHFETTANTILNMVLDAAVQVGGHIVYVEV